MHSFEIVLIEDMVNVTEDGAPIFSMASELVLMEASSACTSTRCPRYCDSLVFPEA